MKFNQLYAYTSLARLFHPLIYPTQRLVVILTVLAGIVLGIYTLLTGGDFGDAIGAGFYAGASAFLAWVLAREIDPDHNLSAFIAMLFATLGAFIAIPNILALVGALILIRIINHIVGYPPKLLDSILALVLGIAIMLLTNAWLFGIVVAVALLIDAQLPAPGEMQMSFVLGMLLITLAIWNYLNVTLLNPTRDWLLPMLGVGALFVAHTLTIRQFTTVCDATEAPVMAVRIRAGMLLMLAMAVAFGLVYGDGGVQMLMPLWAVFIGVMVHRGWQMVRVGQG